MGRYLAWVFFMLGIFNSVIAANKLLELQSQGKDLFLIFPEIIFAYIIGLLFYFWYRYKD